MAEAEANVGCFKHVRTQVFMMGFIFFGIPGAFNSIIGLRSGIPAKYTDLGFGILYFLFSFVSLIAPMLVNKFGPRTIMAVGGSVYALFSLSLMLAGPLEAIPYVWVTICAALTGVGAALIWAGNGAMLLSYPTENLTATYISDFWVIFNLGAVFGGINAFVANRNPDPNATEQSASASTFAIYIAMAVAGTFLVFLLQPLEKVRRADGTLCVAPKKSGSILDEVKEMIAMMCSPCVLALLPLFLYSNWFYSFQLGIFCKGVFTPAAAGIGNALYWGAQMVGAKNLGCLCDAKSLSVGQRAYSSVIASAVLISIGWIWGIRAVHTYGVTSENPRSWDYNEAGVIEAFCLMFVWGYCDALIQTWCYWAMGQLYKSSADFARIAGIFKFAQSFGSSASFIIAFSNPTVMTQLYTNIFLFVVSLPGAFFLCNRVSKKQVVDVEDRQPLN